MQLSNLSVMLSYEFMKNILLAGLMGGAVCSVVGVLVISMELALVGIAISHAAFAGSIIFFFAGIDPLIGAIIGSLLAAATIGPMADRGDFSPDTVMGVIFAMTHGLAFLFMGMIETAKTQALNLMWGNALGINDFALQILLFVFILVIGTVVLFFKEVQAIIFNREIALAVGLPASWIFYALLFLTGTTVAANLQSIGGLLVSTLIITPAAAAYQLTYNLKNLFLLAASFGVVSCWLGSILSYLVDVPCGAVIVLISSLIFLIANIFSPKRRVKRLRLRKKVEVSVSE